MLNPWLCERVRLTGRPEIFLVVVSNLTAHTADLIRLGTNVIEHDVPWVMLEAVEDDGANWREYGND